MSVNAATQSLQSCFQGRFLTQMQFPQLSIADDSGEENVDVSFNTVAKGSINFSVSAENQKVNSLQLALHHK